MNIVSVESIFDRLVEDELVSIEQLEEIAFLISMQQGFGALKTTLNETLITINQLLEVLTNGRIEQTSVEVV